MVTLLRAFARRTSLPLLHLALLVGWPSQPASAQAESPRVLANKIEQAIGSRQMETAQQALRQLLEQPHVDLDILLETGGKLAEHELFDAARTVFQRGLHDYPDSFETRYNLVLADLALMKWREAKQVLDAASPRSEPQRLAQEYLKGKIYEGLEQPVAAERCYTVAFHGAPRQENYALDFGIFCLRRRQYAKAIEILAAGAKYHPDSVYMELGLALAQVLGDDPTRAVATCRRIVAKDPGFAEARLLMVAALYMNGEYQNCLRETEDALRQPDVPPYVRYVHAASLLKLNSTDYPAMLRDLDSANSSIANCVFCYFTRSKVHEQMGDDGSAVADLETLVTRMDPAFEQAWYRLANLYEHTNRHEDASKAFARFRALKSAQTNREAEYLRQTFLDALK